MKRILAAHIIKIHETTDLDYKLTSTLIYSRAAQSLSYDDTIEIRRRLVFLRKRRDGVQRTEVMIPEPEPEVIDEPVEDRQDQHVIQSALQKCVDNNIDLLNLEELEVLVKYGKVLAMQANGPQKTYCHKFINRWHLSRNESKLYRLSDPALTLSFQSF